MPHLISNLYEKNYTPFTAKLAPRDLCNRPSLGKLGEYIKVMKYVSFEHFVSLLNRCANMFCFLYLIVRKP